MKCHCASCNIAPRARVQKVPIQKASSQYTSYSDVHLYDVANVPAVAKLGISPFPFSIRINTVDPMNEVRLVKKGKCALPCMFHVPHHFYRSSYSGTHWAKFFSDVTPLNSVELYHG